MLLHPHLLQHQDLVLPVTQLLAELLQLALLLLPLSSLLLQDLIQPRRHLAAVVAAARWGAGGAARAWVAQG